MPRQSEWIPALAGILPALKRLPPEAPIDRAAIEALFGLSPRQATRLLHRFGAERAGGALLLPAGLLRQRLEQFSREPAVEFELHRRERLAERLREARRETLGRRVPIPVPHPQPDIDGDPHIQLGPGELRIGFDTPVELLERLWRLAQAAAEDWDGFVARTRATGARRGGEG
jgi:hypothetical protein